jgi:hypothetical protein
MENEQLASGSRASLSDYALIDGEGESTIEWSRSNRSEHNCAFNDTAVALVAYDTL